MRILVVSDTHGDEAALYDALMQQPKAEVVIHLGDGERDVEAQKFRFPGKCFYRCEATVIGVPPFRPLEST